MIRDAKAAPTEPTQRRGGRFDSFIRGALATRASSRRADGSGVSASCATASARSQRAVALAVLLGVIATLVFVSSAGATSFQRPFKEVFGSVEQPAFGWPALLAVDPNTGDLLVGDANTKSIKRFHADGTPAPFTALGSNAIDGKRGPGGHTRAECETAPEPSSCDETPQNGLEIENTGLSQQIAIDSSGGPTNGNIYITQNGQNLVDIFSPGGKYLGQLTATEEHVLFGPCGVAVDSAGAVYVADSYALNTGEVAKFVPTANPPVNADNTAVSFLEGQERICRLAVGSGPSAGWLFGAAINPNRVFKINQTTLALSTFAAGFQNPPTVDPTNGNPILGAGGAGQGQAPEGVEFSGSLEQATEPLSRLFPLQGSKLMRDMAASPAGDVYIVVGPSDPRVFVYGTPAVVPTPIAEPASNVTGTKATLSGKVNPSGLPVSKCVFEWGTSTSYGNEEPCVGAISTDSSPHPVHVNLSGLTPNGTTYHFRIAATNENGTETSDDQVFTTAQTVATEAASGIGTDAATLNGTVRPEGKEVTECFFEWELASRSGYEHSTPCDPSAPGIPADFSPHSVTAGLTGLQAGTTYRFQLVATNEEGVRRGEPRTFTTLGSPRIREIRARNADRSSVTIEAKIDPGGFPTTYHFEWGAGSSYGKDVPVDFEAYAGSGTEGVQVSAKLTGLSSGSTYHYRLVANNSAGTTASADQRLETLNSCGLPEGRCFELVSRKDAGPVANPGETAGAAELVQLQAAPSGPGALAYVVESGFPDATKGGEVLYEGLRSPSGWKSSQFSPPLLVRTETSGGSSTSSITRRLSADLSCAVVQSNQPLTGDAGPRLVVEAGGSNLYRRHPDGSYTAITKLSPLNPDAVSGGFIAAYNPAGMSADCSKAVFTTPARYPGVPFEGTPLYEWDEGTLRNAAVVPGPSGEITVSGSAGGANVVSEDGSRVFFSAARKTSGIPSEVGKTAVFVREDGTTSRDLSLSETATPDSGATFRYATPDGSRAFFTANAGLTSESSSVGTDLYEYDLESDDLTDLSISQEEGGAQVGAFIGASEDGSRVYFVARAQLVPGEGPTLAQNLAAGTYSIYGGGRGRAPGFAGTVGADPAAMADLRENARVSPDGRYLLFESRQMITGYESHGEPEAYLYDSQATSEPTVCVSCRQDGKAPVPHGVGVQKPLKIPVGSAARPAQTLVVSGGEPKVFFLSPNSLAAGAPEGDYSLYEWSHGQVFRIVSEPPGSRSSPGDAPFVKFAGASADGSDLYLVTTESLSWEDGDGRSSVYDARIGGGFPEPPPPPPACDPGAEGSCSGPSQPAGASAPAAGSATFSGPGNAKPKAAKRKKRHKRHKKHHAGRRGKRHAQQHRARNANGNRRAGK